MPVNRWLSLLRSLRFLLLEGTVVFLLVFALNNYLENPELPIRSDGMGYYEYLPSLFIYRDLARKDLEAPPDRVRNLHMYVEAGDRLVNKYPAGTALLMAPFFFGGHLAAIASGAPQDGYSLPYQKAMFYAGLFYLFFGLHFLRRFLSEWRISWPVIFFVQGVSVFTTSIMHYVNFEPTFSHLYSFFVVNAFLFVTVRFFRTPSQRFFLWACVLLGLIAVIRPVNLLVIGVVPLLAGSAGSLRQGIVAVFERPAMIAAGGVLFVPFAAVQMVFWFLQTGHFIVDSYPGESFNFASPAFFQTLFSYKKGLFVYTPATFVALAGIGVWLWQGERYRAIAWSAFFAGLTYVLSSWWSWYYGCSFGNRAFIDFYGILFLPLAVLVQYLRGWWRALPVVLCLAFVPVIMIQTYQYKKFILDWIEMDREKYWEIFLCQEDQFRGLYFKKDYALDGPHSPCLDSFSLGNLSLVPGQEAQVFERSSSSIPGFFKVDLIELSLEADFAYDQKARIELGLEREDNGEVVYWHSIALLLLKEEPLGTYHRGVYRFEIPDDRPVTDYRVAMRLYAGPTGVEVKDVHVRFYELR